LYFEVKIINASLSHLKFSSGLNIQLILWSYLRVNVYTDNKPR
jgi:hypothetical protein